MPIIKVWCLPKAMTEERLKILCDAIINTVESVPELGLTGKKGSITVLFPTDRMDYGLGEEIIAEVTGLFIKPERTEAVRNELARKITVLLHGYFPSAKKECFIHPFDQTSGYCSIDPHVEIDTKSFSQEIYDYIDLWLKYPMAGKGKNGPGMCGPELMRMLAPGV